MHPPLPRTLLLWVGALSLLVASGAEVAAQERPPPPRPRGADVVPELLGEDVNGVELPADPGGQALDDPSFEPRYVLERIVVRGNEKTREAMIRRELLLAPGDFVSAGDDRVELARVRLLSLGYFLDVRLSLKRGKSRGRAVLYVDVLERGTVVVKGLFLGTSEATALWGGLDVAETNLFGRGMMLSGGFVTSTRPTVPGAEPAMAFRAQVAGPAPRPGGFALSGSLLVSRGSEFFRAFGPASEVDPLKHVASTTRRLGGTLGIGTELSRTTRLAVQGRFEQLDATLPVVRTRDLGDGRADAIDFGIRAGTSRLSTALLSLDIDERSDPILPRHGHRVLFSVETGLALLGSHYSFAKGVLQASQYFPVGETHAFSLHAFAGALYGSAPYFDRFFVADLNMLLPSRALGLNFSTLPSRNLLGTSIAEHRFESYAVRFTAEYAVPLWRQRGFIYGGDAFVGLGVFSIASEADLRWRDRPLLEALPIDVTADLGIRLDTYIGIFNISIANALGRVPY